MGCKNTNVLRVSNTAQQNGGTDTLTGHCQTNQNKGTGNLCLSPQLAVLFLSTPPYTNYVTNMALKQKMPKQTANLYFYYLIIFGYWYVVFRKQYGFFIPAFPPPSLKAIKTTVRGSRAVRSSRKTTVY